MISRTHDVGAFASLLTALVYFPLKIKMGFPPISSLRIKTGKGFEKYIFFPAIIIYSFWFGLNNQDKIVGILKLIKF